MNGACHSSSGSGTYYALYMVYIDFYRNLHNHVWHLFIDACESRQGEEEGEREKNEKNNIFSYAADTIYCYSCGTTSLLLLLCWRYAVYGGQLQTILQHFMALCVAYETRFHFISYSSENIERTLLTNHSQMTAQIANCSLLAVWQPQVASNYDAVSHILNYEINRNLSGNFNFPAGGKQARAAALRQLGY